MIVVAEGRRPILDSVVEIQLFIRCWLTTTFGVNVVYGEVSATRDMTGNIFAKSAVGGNVLGVQRLLGVAASPVPSVRFELPLYGF